MSTTNELLTAIKTEFKNRLNALKTCEIHPGRFNLQELKRLSAKTPALLVSSLGTVKVNNPGTGEAKPVKQLVVYIVTKTTAQLSAEEACRNLVDAIEHYLESESPRWGVNGTGQPQAIRSDNLYSSEVDKNGVMLWAITWQQHLTLGESLFIEDGTLPSQLYVGDNTGSYEPL
ncbi:hypothetical protein [Thiomicrorhabdus sp. Kp2]|uniref:hypothetical protein n=1 Tax=Thiomicrorhabdus sp. Kp2 TaxID=1123518 RepID=UPI000405F48C|nr:hypothetical protein [Thiomicrorhabdus sp. Kp2]